MVGINRQDKVGQGWFLYVVGINRQDTVGQGSFLSLSGINRQTPHVIKSVKPEKITFSYLFKFSKEGYLIYTNSGMGWVPPTANIYRNT